MILELDDPTRARLDHRRIADLTSACVSLASSDGTFIALRALARRWQHLDEEVRENDQHIETLVRQAGPGLLASQASGNHSGPASGHRRRQP